MSHPIQGDETLVVETTRGHIRVRAELFDSHRGEKFGAIIALDPDKRVAGYIDYSLFEGEAHIKFAHIDADVRGQGLARKMVRSLRLAYPDHSITHGDTVISFNH
jgi:ribosomal protein S18 acetylase RimI-like enzyme